MRSPFSAGSLAVITGAASGIGAEFARALSNKGMDLLLSDISKEPLQALADELNATAIVCDVRDSDAVQQLAAAAEAHNAPVGAVFANAGVMKTARLEDTAAEDWTFMIGVNLIGTANMVRAFVPILKSQTDGSRFVATASVAGLVSAPMSGAYNATKHAVISLCETLHQELKDDDPHIGVSVICPGAVKTDILNLDKYDQTPPDVKLHVAMKKLMDEKGMSAREMVHESLLQIEDDKFWVFPQDYVRARFKARSQSILSQSDPKWLGS